MISKTIPSTSHKAAPPKSASSGTRQDASISETQILFSFTFIQMDLLLAPLLARARRLFPDAQSNQRGHLSDFAIPARPIASRFQSAIERCRVIGQSIRDFRARRFLFCEFPRAIW